MEGKEFFAWVCEIGKHAVLDWLDKQKREIRAVPVGSLAEQIPAPRVGSGWRAPPLPTHLEPVRAFLRSLPPQEREAVTMVDINGLTIQKAADMLGRSYGSVAQARHRAVVKLWSLVEAHPDLLKPKRRK